LNTKSENIVNEHIGGLAVMHWQQICKKSLWRCVFTKLCAINISPCNKVAYLYHLSCHGGINAAWELLSYCTSRHKVLVEGYMF